MKPDPESLQMPKRNRVDDVQRLDEEGFNEEGFKQHSKTKTES